MIPVSRDFAMRSSPRRGILLRLCSRAFFPFAAGPELCLDRITLDLFFRGYPRVNDGRLLFLLLCCVRVHADLCCASDSSALMDSFCARLRWSKFSWAHRLSNILWAPRLPIPSANLFLIEFYCDLPTIKSACACLAQLRCDAILKQSELF